MAGRPRFRLSTVVLGAPGPRQLAEFYQQLLGWPFGAEEDEWVTLRDPESSFSLGFQLEEGHVRPVWPPAPDDQQMQMHLDIEVDDLDRAADYAVSIGASIAGHQPQADVRVLVDPVGHPFCVWAP
jgi:predicted enzyme related to lactoylglutathione lyase